MRTRQREKNPFDFDKWQAREEKYGGGVDANELARAQARAAGVPYDRVTIGDRARALRATEQERGGAPGAGRLSTLRSGSGQTPGYAARTSQPATASMRSRIRQPGSGPTAQIPSGYRPSAPPVSSAVPPGSATRVPNLARPAPSSGALTGIARKLGLIR